jgi:hypothetical protein
MTGADAVRIPSCPDWNSETVIAELARIDALQGQREFDHDE